MFWQPPSNSYSLIFQFKKNVGRVKELFQNFGLSSSSNEHQREGKVGGSGGLRSSPKLTGATFNQLSLVLMLDE